MKKAVLTLASAAVLCACAGNVKNMNQVNDTLWAQDPMNMCNSLIEQNKTALEAIGQKYGAKAVAAAEPLYQELNLKSNAVCRSRIVQQDQIAQLKELRQEYVAKIDEAVKNAK